MSKSSTQLKTTPRGIRQAQHAAIGSDPIRGLIELITNSDDAYGSSKGTVELKIAAREISVIDSAGGIPNLEKALEIGTNTAKSLNNKESRGRLGRGLKDVPVLAKKNSFIIETINKKKYSKIIFEDSTKYDFIEKKIDAKPKHYKLIGCDKTGGTKISFKLLDSIRKPKFKTLRFKLANDFELRGLYEKRDVVLYYGREKTELFCDYSKEGYIKKVDEAINLPTYGEIKFELYQLPQSSDDLPSKSVRTAEAGILIYGKNNIFENTLFKYKGRNGASFFHGTIVAPQIDELYFNFDKLEEDGKDHTSDNPSYIIEPGRQGLDRAHPFTKELENEIETILDKIFDQYDEELSSSSQILDNKSQKELERELQKIMKSIFEEDKDEDDQIVLSDEIELRPIPTNILLGQKKTVSILGDSNFIDIDEKVEISISNENIALSSSEEIVFGSHRNKNITSIYTAQIPLYGNSLGESTINVTIPNKNFIKSFTVNVKEEEEEIIDEFSFEKKTYTSKIGKEKTITILCPNKLVPKNKIVSLSLDNNEEFELITGKNVKLEQFTELDCYGALVKIKSLNNAGTHSYTKIYGSIEGHEAICKLKIKEDNLSGIKPIIKWDDKPQVLPERAKTERNEDTLIVTIYLQHKGIKSIITDKGIIESNQSRVLLAEVFAEAILLFKLIGELGEEHHDAMTFTTKLSKLKRDHIGKFHKIFLALELGSLKNNT